MTRELQKTPFYKIEIGDSSGQNMIPLPYQISRLVDKVEIKELFIEGGCTGGQFTIHFNEGSREPFNIDSEEDTSTAYPLDNDSTGQLTNNPGFLADLNYTLDGGTANITAILPSASGTINDVVASGTESSKSINNTNLTILDDKVTSKKGIKFLFQQRNQIKITWGYLEDLENRRAVRGHIAGIDFDYPDADNPKMVLTSVETGMIFDQVSSIFGTNFSVKKSKGITSKGKVIVDYENIDLKTLIEDFSSNAGMADPLVSAEFADIKLDKNAINIMPAGMSPQQYFTELAKKYDAYFKAYLDPNSGKDTIAFLSKKEFSGQLIINNKSLLSYKTPGSLLKSAKIKAEYNAMTGNAQSGIKDNGEPSTIASNSSVSIAITDAQADLADANPTGNNSVQAAKGTVQATNTPFAVGNHGYTPEINDASTVSRQVYSRAQCQLGNIIMVSLNTIGFAKFRPGPWFVGGLGKRYSGTYYFREVAHTLDATGYVCRMEGSNQSDYGGTGKSADGVEKTQISEQVSTALVQVSANTGTSNNQETASSTYNNNQDSQ